MRYHEHDSSKSSSSPHVMSQTSLKRKIYNDNAFNYKHSVTFDTYKKCIIITEAYESNFFGRYINL